VTDTKKPGPSECIKLSDEAKQAARLVRFVEDPDPGYCYGRGFDAGHAAGIAEADARWRRAVHESCAYLETLEAEILRRAGGG
jgi:hypothetical protein